MKRITQLVIALMFTLGSLNMASVFAQGSGAEIEFKPSAMVANQGQEITLDIVLKNPSQAKVISVRSWFTYDPSVLEGIAIDTSESLFGLSAPGEDTFSASEARVKIGRSNITGGATAPETVVAKVRFRVNTASPMTTEIKAYDYQVSELGHMNVNILDQGFPVNILSEEPKAVTLQLNGGGSGATTDPEPVDTTIIPPAIGGSPYLLTLARPTGLKVSTGSGYADLVWDPVADTQVTGYDLYYGKTSGQYTRRRAVDNTALYRLDGLMNGDTFYFSITAHNSQNQESDYSDEVGIIVNEPLSSTSPFDGFIEALLARIPAQADTGPAGIAFLLFSGAGLAGSTIFRRRKSY